MVSMNIDSWLNRGVTTSTSLVVEYGYWAPLAMAEARTKLMTRREREQAKRLAKDVQRLSTALK